MSMKFRNLVNCSFLFFALAMNNAHSADSLSYSGRLVKNTGAPVAGPVNLKVELAYTNSPGSILCSQNFSNVVLSNGVFHLKVDFDCDPNGTLEEVLAAVPNNESVAIRVVDVTTATPKTYGFQAIHSMPFANIAETSKNLMQMGATNGQVLVWDNTAKKWKPGTVSGASGGTVTNVSASAPLSIVNATSTPTISIDQASSSSAGFLSSADWNTFNNKQAAIAAGTTLQFYRGDKTWQTLDTSIVPENVNLYFTNARALGVPLTSFTTATGAIVATDTILEAFGKTQGQLNSLSTSTNNFLIKNSTDSITGLVNVGTTGLLQLVYTPVGMNDATNKAYVDSVGALKISKSGDTISSGTFTFNGSSVLRALDPVSATDVATKQYVDQLGSKWTLNAGNIYRSSGNVGIGTSTPSQKLEVNGNILVNSGNPYTTTITDNRIYFNRPAGSSYVDQAGIGGNLIFRTSGSVAADTNAMTIASTGNVGIGTTNPGVPLDIQGTGRIIGSMSSSNSTDTVFSLGNTSSNGRAWQFRSNGTTPSAGAAGGFLIYDGTGSTSRLYIDPSGNVGIGTVTPARTLEVATASDTRINVRTTTEAVGEQAGVQFVTGSGLNSSANTIALIQSVITQADPSPLKGDLKFITNSGDGASEKMRITSGGNVGIGTNAPIYPLHVILPDDGTYNGIRFEGNRSTAGGNAIRLELNAPNSPSAANQKNFQIVQLNGNAGGENTLVIRSVNDAGANRAYGFAMTHEGKVGIGLTTPQSTLDVNGSVKVGVDATVCSATIAGAMRFNTPNVEYCNGTVWQAFTSSGAGSVGTSQLADGSIANVDVSATANIDSTKLGTGVVDNTEFNYLNGVTSSIQTQLSNKQPLDATLTALAAFSTNGIMVQTAADTFTPRTITGTANRTVVTNGDGVSGNPTLNIDTGLLPSPASSGQWLKSTGANTSAWTTLASSDITTALGFTPINKAGDTISTGTFNFNGTALLRTLDPIGPTDVTTKQYVDGFGQWSKNASDVYRSSGNVGIGTSSPGEKLHISGGDMRLDNNYALFFRDLANTGSLGIKADTSDRITFRTGGFWDRLVINSSGYVGVGTNTPLAPQHFKNGASGKTFTNASGLIIENNGNSAGYSVLHVATVAAQDALVVTNAGGVGIGKEAPTAKLDIAGNLSINASEYKWASNISLSHTDASTGKRALLALPAISNNARVIVRGVRTTNDGANVFDAEFKVAVTSGTSQFRVLEEKVANTVATYDWYFDSATGIAYLRFGQGANSYTYSVTVVSNTSSIPTVAVDSGSAPAFPIVNSEYALRTSVNDDFLLYTNGSERMRVNSSGLVGIGTTAPSDLLTVSGPGNARVRLNSTSGGTQYVQYPNTGSDAFLDNGTIGSNLVLRTSNAAALDTVGMAVTSTGKVGVGLTTPLFKFHVDGNSSGSADQTIAQFGNASGGSGPLYLTYNAPFVSGNLYFNNGWRYGGGTAKPGSIGLAGGITFQTDDSAVGAAGTIAPGLSTKMSIASNGFVGIGIAPSYLLHLGSDSAAKPGTSTWIIASDERLKDVRAPFTRGLDALLGLNTIYFNYKKDNPLDLPSEKEYVGIKAQEVKKVIPEAVSKDKNGYLHVSNDPIIWTAVNSIKELYNKVLGQDKQIIIQSRQIASKADKAEIEALKKENAELKARLDKIEKSLSKKP